MKKTAISLAMLLLALATTALAAAPAQKERITEISNKYFSIKLPQGWFLPAPPKQQPNGGVSVIFVRQRANVAITVNIAPGRVDVPSYIEKMSADMRKNSFKVSQPVKDGDFYRINISGKNQGAGFFRDCEGTFSAIMIFGPDLKIANEILDALKPRLPGLFPKSVQ